VKLTQYENINSLLSELLANLSTILDTDLVGLYFHGSLVTGDFDPHISDIDLLAALAVDMSDEEFEALYEMHTHFAQKYPEWHERIEVCYASADTLKAIKSRPNTVVKISPGEPFHRIESNREWLMNWYLVREYGQTLFGPPPAAIIEAISKEEFIQAVQRHAKRWPQYAKSTRHSRPAQAYAILTICRALYTCRNGEQASKKHAAAWAANELPQWSHLIHDALAWREDYRNKEVDNEATYPETVRFVNFVAGQIAG
jgi:hypothetical protein